jgi:hypothetical protein
MSRSPGLTLRAIRAPSRAGARVGRYCLPCDSALASSCRAVARALLQSPASSTPSSEGVSVAVREERRRLGLHNLGRHAHTDGGDSGSRRRVCQEPQHIV